jgi:hypothetical protein
MEKSEKGYRHRAIGDHPFHPESMMMGYGYDPHLSEGAVPPASASWSSSPMRNWEKTTGRPPHGIPLFRPHRLGGAPLP